MPSKRAVAIGVFVTLSLLTAVHVLYRGVLPSSALLQIPVALTVRDSQLRFVVMGDFGAGSERMLGLLLVLELSG